MAATEALRIHENIGDRVGTGLSQMRMCNVEIERNALTEAASWCDRAELTLSQTSGMDDNDYRTLAALRGRLYLALGRSKEAVAQFDRAIAPGGAQPADDIAELYELRSRAHAAVGNYPAAFTDQGEYLRRMREQGTLDRIREVAQLRVQFENDQEKQKIVLLEKDKKLAEERLNSQTRTTQLVAIAGLTGLVTAFFLGYALFSNRRHRAELIRLAERDELTGLLNRRAIVRKAVEFLSRAREAQGHAHHRAHRSRSFQVDQRPLRARGRRSAAAAVRGGAAHLAAHERSLRALRRRRIPRAVPRLHAGPGAPVGGAAARRAARSAHARRRPGCLRHAEPRPRELRSRRCVVRPGRAPRRHRALRRQDPGP